MLKKTLITACFALASLPSAAQLELTQQYQDWQRYEAKSFDGKNTVMLGVTEPIESEFSDTIALRCTTEGVNLLFFNSVSREELGYAAKTRIDSNDPFTMDVWIKGSTHWATVPSEHLEKFNSGSQLKVELQGDTNNDSVTLSLNGFNEMYQALTPTCID
ncbi:hypothetical protein [Vibrio sp. LaRot3]|uniref:hypothetical protein n=1 Tax=Vibrio sp. LaRot3 TaxID=2998829 RepID=UPI0022CDFF68|nr:hypothetical protein [Vibrio sp. LaRot3]MDA0148464.1 hypothetical protein [Vibrio sp. LaRot3]